MKVFILHGYRANPEANWFPWLAKQLKDLGHEVTVPEFPTPATFSDWQKVLTSETFDEKTVLIGHSLGGTYSLRLLENSPLIHAAILVAPPIRKLGMEELDHHNASFYDHEFVWDAIHNNCDNIIVYHSDNDPYVPLEQAKVITEKLDAELEMIPNSGHLNADAGFTEFPQLLDKLRSLQE